MTHSDKKHTAISKLILTAAATGIGISAVPYAQADGNGATTVGKLVINPITDVDNKKMLAIGIQIRVHMKLRRPSSAITAVAP